MSLIVPSLLISINLLHTVLISTYDEEIINTVCNRLIEIKSDGTIRDKEISYEEYIEKFGLDLV